MSTSGTLRVQEQPIAIPIGGAVLGGSLAGREPAAGVVLFAHGSGSSRYSPRNRFVAQALQEAGLATLLFDLLTRSEEELDAASGHLRFDIRLLADRLVAATDWLVGQRRYRDLPIGYFGASTGAAAALVAAAERPGLVHAVVSRGGRPDLAGDSLRNVLSPTLLLVGGRDQLVIDLNREALLQLSRCADRRLVIVPGAGHLFEEPGALEEVARLAADWFHRHLGVPVGAGSRSAEGIEVRHASP
jgi:dienelactone hydrolase